MTAEAEAPAKINLCLHVTGRRADGYHLLDSLVVFAGIGDTVRAEPADDWSLTVAGPMTGGVPSGDDNLVMRAARATGGPAAALTLTKRLPVASGIGGGSADAAATLRALAAMDGRAVPDAGALGADVPVCLAGRPARMRGIGERLDAVPPLPQAHLVLVNPGVALSTPAVFAALQGAAGSPLPRMRPWTNARDLADWLAGCRNDLQPAAMRLASAVGDTLAELTAQDCLLARMSGSGATCFGLYATQADAARAAGRIGARQPRWWVAAAPVLA
ncbi:4-diphosphocytidyl-2C-methyl-D-erythritol kinase [Oceaniovalibus guishaninsula JLT2003]|uniref:4-diphosphocytidyl-2-C-methyl-D-erythritol kinase n=1 Tax=Oceaniovalibus guishaninsula JLT2003 TaxID=1231392 RepID=K2HBZ4_9RHOB|nr:4-(cytidine 5'-diphospho)-2-C-methyl-D-erythritol kinase [Oceaniovalibus guishaninsula]EKE44127.1 4-diphosphocytidyl-2C-methyl-D-erythritol kinase [Oceaniovalibus guishaninsula JLT2003]